MTQAGIARVWDVSPSYVNKLVGRGMPLESVEEADKWRIDNLQKPPRSSSGGAVVKGLCESVGAGEVSEEELAENNEAGRVRRSREVEMIAFRVVQDHAKSGNAIAIRSAVHAHGEAQKRTIEAEMILAKKTAEAEWRKSPAYTELPSLGDWLP